MPEHNLTVAAVGMPAAFDYSTLDESVARVARATAERIRANMIGAYVEIGRSLLDVKAQMVHGTFGAWIAAEFGWSDRTAQNYMSAAEWAEANSEIVSYLPPTAVYALSSPSTPEPARAKVIEAVRSGEAVTAKSVKEIVSTAKLQEREEAKRVREEERKAKLSPEQAKKEARSKANREKRRLQQIEEARRWREEQDRQTANAEKLATLILAVVAGDAEATALAADCDRHSLGFRIVSGLGGVR